MRTYIKVQLDSEGASFSNIAEVLEDLGFRPVKGEYDFVYNWDKQATIKESIWFADKVQLALKGLGVWFRVETVET
jgi:hypothetical protein